MKIGLRFFARRFLDFSADTNLAVELDPVKAEGSVRISLELFPLCALVIRKEHKPVVIETLQQHNSHRRSPIAAGGSETHCIYVADTGLDRGGEPIPKLFSRIGMKVAPPQ